MSTINSLVNLAERVVQMHDAGTLSGPKDSNAIRELGRLIQQYNEEQGIEDETAAPVGVSSAAIVAASIANTVGEHRVHRIGQEKMTDPSAFDFVMVFRSPPYDGELHVAVKAMKDAFKFQFTRAISCTVDNYGARETLKLACEEILAAMKGAQNGDDGDQ